MYDYYSAIKRDIHNYISKNYTPEEIKSVLMKNDKDYIVKELTDILWWEDEVTRKSSGTYFGVDNETDAEQALVGNLDLLYQALSEFQNFEVMEEGAAGCDVLIRLYLLKDCIGEVWTEILEQNAN